MRNVNNLHFCSGSILNTRWILTSTVCLTFATNFTIVAGSNNLNGSGDTYQAASYLFHPLYNSRPFEYDALLVNTTTPIVYSTRIQPVVLTPLFPIVGAVAVISGWGTNDIASQITFNELRDLNTTVLSQTTCQSRFGGIFNVTSSVICTFVANGGSCYFDYGAPITVCNIQFGIVRNPFCGVFPDLHTPISNVYNWIISII